MKKIKLPEPARRTVLMGDMFTRQQLLGYGYELALENVLEERMKNAKKILDVTQNHDLYQLIMEDKDG